MENFAYKTAMSWWLFAGAICLALLIALATVSYHAVKAALTDPVKALRYE
jgi:putative ABC transport system permease protein